MKKILLVLFAVSAVFGIERISTTYTAVPGAVVSSSGLNANRDTLRNGVNRIIDTISSGKYVRWTLFSNHDSTFKWMNIDTIPSADTIKVTGLRAQRGTIDTLTSSAATLNGSVGINTASPQKTLHVYNASSTASVRIEGGGGSKGVFDIVSTDNSSLKTLNITDGTNMLMTVRGNGNVGIGVAAPSKKLDVSGTIKSDTSYSTVDSSGRIACTGTAKVDSISSSKGISGTYGRFTTLNVTGTATAYSLADSNGAIRHYDIFLPETIFQAGFCPDTLNPSLKYRSFSVDDTGVVTADSLRIDTTGWAVGTMLYFTFNPSGGGLQKVVFRSTWGDFLYIDNTQAGMVTARRFKRGWVATKVTY